MLFLGFTYTVTFGNRCKSQLVDGKYSNVWQNTVFVAFPLLLQSVIFLPPLVVTLFFSNIEFLLHQLILGWCIINSSTEFAVLHCIPSSSHPPLLCISCMQRAQLIAHSSLPCIEKRAPFELFLSATHPFSKLSVYVSFPAAQRQNGNIKLRLTFDL